jgi:peptidoglycan/LPS O-acetylase OafA/YrhL
VLQNARKSLELARLSDVDVFRGAAALLVAAMHTREIMWVGLRQSLKLHGGPHLVPGALLEYATFPLIWGSIGVPIFFVLSGYCIHRSQAFARVRCTSCSFSFASFYVRRFLRIYPVFAGALLFTFVCDTVSHCFTPSNARLADTGISALLANVFAIQGILRRNYGSNGVLWTLSLEVQFYALYPLLLAAMRRLGNLRTLFLLLVLNIVSYILLQRNGYQVFSNFYISWYLGALVAEGEAAGMAKKVFESTKRRHLMYGLSIVLVCSGCTLFFLGQSRYFLGQYGAFQLWMASFAVFFFVFLGRPTALPGMAPKLLRRIGIFSYSVYVIHLPFVVLVSSVCFNSVKQASLVPFVVTLAGVLGCAYGFFFVVERPTLALLQKLKRPARFYDVAVAG